VFGADDESGDEVSSMEYDRMLIGVSSVRILFTTTHTNELVGIKKWVKGNKGA
jgi:hypothetical protein